MESVYSKKHLDGKDSRVFPAVVVGVQTKLESRIFILIF